MSFFRLVFGHGKLAQVGIDDRYRVWRNLVGEIGRVAASIAASGLKAISLLIIRELSAECQ
jgi:hypothetical protein